MDTRETSVTLSASASTRRLAVVSGHVGLLQVHAVPFSCTVAATTTAAVEGLRHLSPPRPLRRRPRVAAIVTAYFPQSHADVIITKLIKGYSTDAGFVPPSVDIVSLYMDQCIQPAFDNTLPLDQQPGSLATPGGRNPRDIGVAIAEEHGIPIYSTIRRALYEGDHHYLGGGKPMLNIDGVVMIG